MISQQEMLSFITTIGIRSGFITTIICSSAEHHAEFKRWLDLYPVLTGCLWVACIVIAYIWTIIEGLTAANYFDKLVKERILLDKDFSSWAPYVVNWLSIINLIALLIFIAMFLPARSGGNSNFSTLAIALVAFLTLCFVSPVLSILQVRWLLFRLDRSQRRKAEQQ